MTSFNLLDEDWIPCAWNGSVQEVSIREALLEAHQIGNVQARSPLETTALVRLLLAVAFAACGPRTRPDAASLLRAKQFPAEAITSYLDTWHDRFDLFGDQPFLQIGDMSMAQETPLAVLATEAATGNNATLFDHACDNEPAAFTPAEAARLLLAAQAFALGFGKAAEAVVRGRPFPRPYLADAICLRGITVWLSGQTLFETLALNMLPGEITDRPLWERTDPLARLDRVEGGKRISVPAASALDRYVWQSRMARLLPETEEGRIVVRRCYFTQGREADKSQGDPMKVFIQSKKDGIYPRGLNADRASWRDLHSLLAFENGEAIKRVPIFQHVAYLVQHHVVPPSTPYGLNVVGLATDPGKAGKFLLWRHDKMSILPALLEDENLVSRLGQMLDDAEFVAGELWNRVRNIAKSFVPPHVDPDPAVAARRETEPGPFRGKSDPKTVAHLADSLDARPAYWARLENHFPALVAGLPDDEERAMSDWHKCVEKEAEDALRESCRQLGSTPQALRAKACVSFRFNADSGAVKQQRAERKKQQELKQRKRTHAHEHIAAN